jgi:V8-like Glu-specific endopeptidase
MKYRILLCIGLLLSRASYSQNPNNRDWIQRWQQMTISIGNIRYDTVVRDGKKNVFPYYNILGTGIICYVSNSPFNIIVTAKHVLQDERGKFLDSVRIRFSWEDGSSVYSFFGHMIHLNTKKGNIIYTHPAKDFDLACFPMLLKDSISGIQAMKVVNYQSFADKENYQEGAGVYVLGYPGSVGKTYWTRALIRKGIISWIPKDNIGEKKFLIDASVYPGNSGGPVITEIPMIQFRDTTDSDILKDYRFLGIVIERRFDFNKITTSKNKSVYDSSGIVITSKNKQVTNSADDFLYSRESMGIAVVEPAENVLALLKSLDDTLHKMK